MPEWARSELIVGGQKSGKSRRAERLAGQWLAASPEHRAVLVATGQAEDDEMRERIARHRADRALHVPRLQTLEEPRALAAALHAHSTAQTLVVVDCLTLWLTHLMMPSPLARAVGAAAVGAQVDALCAAIAASPGPVVLVGNEIGLGVVPMGSQVRAFVDALGGLNQQVAAVCARVSLMVAGLPLVLKDAS